MIEGSVEALSASPAPAVMIFTRSYPPAYHRGGPARSLHALVEALVGEFRFSVVTSAFDDPTAAPMSTVTPDQWCKFGYASIWYESRRRMSPRKIALLLREVRPELVYLNSLFDFRFAILPLLTLRTISRSVPILLAPRGELSSGALRLKRMKKHAFITGFKLLRLHKSVTWHASTDQEKDDIQRVFGLSVRSHIAINLRSGLLHEASEKTQIFRLDDTERPGSLVFFSRITPKKNLAVLLRAIPLVKRNVHLSIAGPIADARYWKQCLKLIKDMTVPGSVSYAGVIPPDEVVSFLERFDLFVLPTLGENFGHVVLESLAAGTPVIIGNNAPWSQVASSGAGWVCDPGNPGAIAELIDNFLSLDPAERHRMRVAARNLASEVLHESSSVTANRSMFRALTSSESS
jgi:glycosyltransferase involved in cell wall biosynthesis